MQQVEVLVEAEVEVELHIVDPSHTVEAEVVVDHQPEEVVIVVDCIYFYFLY